MSYKPIKSVRVTLRLTEDALKMIQSFGEEGDTFAAAHDKMLTAISGERQKALNTYIFSLENRLSMLRKQVNSAWKALEIMTDAQHVMQQVKQRIDSLHDKVERGDVR